MVGLISYNQDILGCGFPVSFEFPPLPGQSLSFCLTRKCVNNPKNGLNLQEINSPEDIVQCTFKRKTAFEMSDVESDLHEQLLRGSANLISGFPVCIAWLFLCHILLLVLIHLRRKMIRPTVIEWSLKALMELREKS